MSDISTVKYNYRSNIWVGETAPAIRPEDANNFFYTLFWYKLNSETPDDRTLMVNLFMPVKDPDTGATTDYQRKWVAATTIDIAKIDALGGFYNIEGDEWAEYYNFVFGNLPEPPKNWQTVGNVGVDQQTGKLRIQTVDNGTFTYTGV